MKYFIDTEFIEGDVPCRIKGFSIPKWLIKPNNTIQPISVGICSSDGREYYAISKDFNLKEAWNRWQPKKKVFDSNNIKEYMRLEKEYWIRDNVLFPIYKEYVHGDMQNVCPFSYSAMKGVLRGFGKTNKQIAEEIKAFVYSESTVIGDNIDVNILGTPTIAVADLNTEFYGYYADYDWVVFCWLFGTMMNLPDGFPMYCRDIKQMLDEKYMCQENKYPDMSRIKSWLQDVKKHPDYPKQTDEHHALADARWNKQLYEFLNNI